MRSPVPSTKYLFVCVHIPQRGGIVVGPHQVEFRVGALQCRDQPFVELPLEAGRVLVPVPVHDEDVDAVLAGQRDMLAHDRGSASSW